MAQRRTTLPVVNPIQIVPGTGQPPQPPLTLQPQPPTLQPVPQQVSPRRTVLPVVPPATPPNQIRTEVPIPTAPVRPIHPTYPTPILPTPPPIQPQPQPIQQPPPPTGRPSRLPTVLPQNISGQRPAVPQVPFVLPEVPSPKPVTVGPVVAEVATKYGPKKIYDNQMTIGSIPNMRFPLALDEIVEWLKVPSYKFYYLSKSGYIVPHLSSTLDVNQMKTDYNVWLSVGRFVAIVTTNDAPTAIAYVTTGRSTTMSNIPTNEFRRFLDTLPVTPTVKSIAIADLQNIQKYPYNPAADLKKVFALMSDVNSTFQQYFDEQEIFTADPNFYTYVTDPSERFFYLTRFYFKPTQNNFQKAMRFKYDKMLYQKPQNSIKELINNTVSKLKDDNFYLVHRSDLDSYFTHMLDNPNAKWHDTFGAYNMLLLKNQFYDEYFPLVYRPGNTPELTLEYLRTIQSENVTNILHKYTDSEIIQTLLELLPNIIDIYENHTNRNDIITNIVVELTTTKYIVLPPNQGARCRNRTTLTTDEPWEETNEPILGYGSILGGLKCYSFNELFQHFEAGKSEDIYTFDDPLSRDANAIFRSSDLEQMRQALIDTGQTNNPMIKEFIRQLQDYIRKAKDQESGNILAIRSFRNFANSNLDNRNLIRTILVNMFLMSMYMRQWKGPPDPYPLNARETGQTTRQYDEAPPECVSQRVYEAAISFRDVFDRLPANLQTLFWNMKMLSTTGVLSYPVKFEFDKVFQGGEGRQCIRLASEPFAYSSAYYLKQFLNEDIPGYDPSRTIDRIQ